VNSQRLTSCGEKAGQSARMGNQLTRHNLKTHLLWREGRTVSTDGHSAHKAQFKDSHTVERRQDSQQGWALSSQGTIQRLTCCGEKAGESAGMGIQFTRYNSKTHILWREGRTVSRDGHLAHKAQFKDSHSVERKKDSQHGWAFSSQGTIQRLTSCGEKAGQSAGMGIGLTRHNSKTHKLWREGRTVNRDGHSAHKAQFKDSQTVERRQDSQQGWAFSSQGIIQRLTFCGEKTGQSAWMGIQLTRHDSLSVESRQDSQHRWAFSSQGTIQRLTSCREKVGQSARMGSQLTRHNSKTHKLWREGRTVSTDGHSANKAQFKDSHPVERRHNNQWGWALSSQGTIQRLTSCGEKAGQWAQMGIQLTRHNSKTHKLWREGRTVSTDGHSAHKAQFKDSHSVERKQDSQQGWAFSSQGTIQRLTSCGEKAGQSAQMGIQLTRHNSKTHILWREGTTISGDGHSAHKAQFKDSQAVESRQDSQQGWAFSSQDTIQRLTSCGEKAGQSAQMGIQLTRHNSKTHILWRESRTVTMDGHSAHKAQFKDSHPVERRQDSQHG
jgi:uncharacterized protein YegP (UPF0339 family)